MDEPKTCFCVDSLNCEHKPILVVNRQTFLCWPCYLRWARAVMRMAAEYTVSSLVKSP